MIYESKTNSKDYFPPILGNGEISLAPDCEGVLNYTDNQYEDIGLQTFDGIVVRSGRRSNNNSRMKHSRLFSFGKFMFGEGSDLCDWSQELVEFEGCVKTLCEYKDGAKIHTNCFIHPTLNIYAVNKTFENIGKSKEFYYDFVIEGYNVPTMDITTVTYTKSEGDEAVVGFKHYGMDIYIGEARLCMDKNFEVIPISNGVRLQFEASEGENVTLFYYLEDNLEVESFEKKLVGIKKKIDEFGYNGLLNECKANYKAFFELGYVKTDDKKLNDIYVTSLYALKCYTTKYSIPVGLNNASWDGRFFAFDEHYSFYGLLTANRHELAKRVPEFRLDVCLETAIKLASDCHKTEDTEEMAKFLWETGEKGDIELAPIGPWVDHIFHISIIGIGAYEYYEYTKDKEFLSRCYRMIRACAKYYTKSRIYRDGERIYLGKCMDIERLGAAVENPFMSSCGAIKLLECCADASEILSIDEEYRKECRFIAGKLRESLPVDNGMFVPFDGCKQKSIAVFAGKYPFDVIEENDERLIKAWTDFEEDEEKYGNMYPTGRKVSPWYACWKATGYARIKSAEKAYASLIQSYESTGVFNEMFEINEPTVRMRPWFTTACGMFISTVNEMLLQSDGKTINILPAYPIGQGDMSFKLAVKGDAVAEVEIKAGNLVDVKIISNGKNVTDKFEILFKSKKIA